MWEAISPKGKAQNQLRVNSLLYTPNMLWNVDFRVMEDILSMDEYMVLGREIFLTGEHQKPSQRYLRSINTNLIGTNVKKITIPNQADYDEKIGQLGCMPCINQDQMKGWQKFLALLDLFCPNPVQKFSQF